MMKCSFQIHYTRLLAAAFHCFILATAGAQTCGSSAGKSLHDLQLSLQKNTTIPFSPNLLEHEKLTFTDAFLPEQPKQGIFLPQWSAEDLPFFCKIEHNWAKNRARIPVKFRLGSVDYVDWLEGKSWDKLRY